MSRTLIIYLSQTGNTKMIAETIYSALEGDKEIFPVENINNQSIDDFDLVFIGFPVHSHSIPYKIEALLKKIPVGKKIALFSTHGSLSGNRLSREALEYAAVLTPKTKLLGTFSCRGKVSLKAQEYLSKSPEHKIWAEMAPSASSHPDEGDLEDAKSFARKIQLLKAQKY